MLSDRQCFDRGYVVSLKAPSDVVRSWGEVLVYECWWQIVFKREN